MGMLYGWIPARSKRKPKQAAFKPMKAATLTSPRLEEHRTAMAQHQSLSNGVGNATIAGSAHYDNPELAFREARARNVKHTVAPICNKGGYQLISDEADLKTVGRKV